MESDQEKSIFHSKRPSAAANMKRIVKNYGRSQLVMRGGAIAIVCFLALASIFKKSKKKIVSPKMSQDGDSNVDDSGFGESTRGVDNDGRQMEGIFLESSSTDMIIRNSCHTTWSTEDSNDENRRLITKPILEKNENKNMVDIIYDGDDYPNPEKSIKYQTQNNDGSSKVAKRFSSRSFDETWQAEWTYKPSTSSSSSSSSSGETSSSGVLLHEIEGDDKNIDIFTYIDDHDEDGDLEKS